MIRPNLLILGLIFQLIISNSFAREYSNVFNKKKIIIINLSDWEKRKLKIGKIPHASWQGHAWNYSLGQSTFRYQKYSPILNYKKQKKFFDSETTQEMIQNQESHLLSPAEKYDLLIGDHEMTLTTNLRREIEVIAGAKESIASWRGLCHGWAPASLMVSAPMKTIEVINPNGQKILFYPHDILSLIILFWANGHFPIEVWGRRCEEQKASDFAIAMTVDPKQPACEQNDLPAETFHQVIVDNITNKQAGIVMEEDRSHAVNNVPVVAYEYEYYNLISNQEEKIEDLALALVKHQSTTDQRIKFKVGLKMKLQFHEETLMNKKSIEKNKTVREYKYILYLDNQTNIVSGQWLSKNTPDFLWTNYQKQMAKGIHDEKVISAPWSFSSPLPKEYLKFAQGFITSRGVVIPGESSERRPLKQVLDQLLLFSNLDN